MKYLNKRSPQEMTKVFRRFSSIQSQPYQCFLDKKRIQQVFLNLLSNALKFTNSSGLISITVTLMNDRLEIQVKDTGIGITENDQDKLFKLFGYLKSTEQMNTQGIGLGLYICKQIVEEFGGQIHVDSVPHRGSAFTFFMRMANQGP